MKFYRTLDIRKGRCIGKHFARDRKQVQHEDVPPATRGIILLVEDDVQDAELFRLSLTEIGSPYELVVVQFARDAINYLCHTGKYADETLFAKSSLIVLDLSLPGMSGLEFLTWAKGEPPETIPPIAVLSYSTLERDRQLTRKLGAKAYFVKSANLEETVAMIRNLLLLNASPVISYEPN